MSGTGTRQQAELRGRRAERLAALYLRTKGFGIVKTRYKTPVGEIDLIARRGKLIVFIEVKWRSKIDDALDAVHWQTQSRIAKAAGHFTAIHPEFSSYYQRFDVIALAPWRWPVHLKQAFDAPDTF
ncbi:MAG: YraN family protein [Hyphomicrobiales bacterium]